MSICTPSLAIEYKTEKILFPSENRLFRARFSARFSSWDSARLNNSPAEDSKKFGVSFSTYTLFPKILRRWFDRELILSYVSLDPWSRSLHKECSIIFFVFDFCLFSREYSGSCHRVQKTRPNVKKITLLNKKDFLNEKFELIDNEKSKKLIVCQKRTSSSKK